MIKKNDEIEKKENDISKDTVKEKRSGKSDLWKYTKIFIIFLVLAVLLGGKNILMYKKHWGNLREGLSNSLQQRLERIGVEKKKEKESSSVILPPSIIAEEEAVTSIVEKSAPAVVSVIITKDIPKIDTFMFNPFGGSLNNDSFSPFFSQPSGEVEKQEIGGGTGFIVSEEGLIVTNRHVVNDREAEYTVMTNDGKEYDAKVLARDNFYDIAVIKVDPKRPKKGKGVEALPTLPLGDSNNAKLGQTVIAIGNSLGEFRNTISKGIISGLRRNITAGGFSGTEELSELIQTDAAINEGNSGGPLINLRGEVVGVNVAMAVGAENIGFALPINAIKGTIKDVEENGKIIRPHLGIRYIMINKAIQERNNLPYDYGALVVRGGKIGDLAVIPGSPADKAGIEENDIILEIDGEKVKEKNALAKIINKKEIGDTIEVKIWRQEEEKTLMVKLVEAPQTN